MLDDVGIKLCSLAIALLVLFNIRIQDNVKTLINRLFFLLAVFGVLDISFDIVVAVMIRGNREFSILAQQLVLYVFYSLELLMPQLMLTYILSLYGFVCRENRGKIIFYSVPYLLMMGLVVTNPLMGWLFNFNGAGHYQRGSLFPLIYFYYGTYLVLYLIKVLQNRKQISKRNLVVFWEFIILGCLLCIQVLFVRALLTGTAIAIVLIILVLTINNPSRKIDSLTGSFDSVALLETLEECRRQKKNCYLIASSYENISHINLVFGVEEGNRLLQATAQALMQYAGKRNVFNVAGNRFVILCYSRQVYETTLFAVRAYFQQPHQLRGIQMQVPCFICAVNDVAVQSTPEELLNFTDYLISQAKGRREKLPIEADDEIARQYRRHKDLDRYLETAIRQSLFEVCFQPVYSLREERFVSAEVLARLQHPELGAILPSEFIRIAEENGEIGKVERCILHQACTCLCNMPHLKELLDNVQVNISPATFFSQKDASGLLDIIRSYGLDPSYFQLEITETAATTYWDEIDSWAQQMRQAGIGLALDDFGSGYANMDAVLKLPFDTVKMDRTLLVEAMRAPRSAIFYKSQVETLRKLGFRVVAEGAETAEDVAFLRRTGVDAIQGFFFAQPAPCGEILTLLEKTAHFVKA